MALLSFGRFLKIVLAYSKQLEHIERAMQLSPYAVATTASFVKSPAARAILEPLADACDAAERAFDRARNPAAAKIARKAMDKARKAFALAIEPMMLVGTVTIGADNFAR